MSKLGLAASKIDVKLSNGTTLEKNDVGVIELHNNDNVSVFFIRIWDHITLDKKDVEIFRADQTGDSYEKKVCNICHKLLLTQQFARNQNGVNNRPIRRPSCNDCRKLLDGLHMKAQDKSKWMKEKPIGVPFECPICKKRTIAGITSKVVLDHNHKTGVPRAWICDSCNTGIGRFKDDVGLLQRAIAFLD